MKEAYQKALEKIRPSENLRQQTLNEMKTIFREKKNKKKCWWKIPAVIAVCSICLLGSLPVMAAFVPGFAELVALISPELAGMLTPVQLSCTDNGIRMQVEAVIQDEEEIVAYLTLQDLERDRIDESIDLYNYVIYGYTTFTHQVIDYDEQLKKATIQIQAFGGEDSMPSDKTTVQVQSFLGGEKEYQDVPIIVDIPQEEVQDVLSVEVCGGGGALIAELERKEDRTIHILRPGERQTVRDDLNFVYLTGAGFVDGKLHIQTWWAPSIDNHGFIELRNTNGENISASNVSFGLTEEGQAKGRETEDFCTDYIEYIFDISPTELDNYKIYGDFFADSVYTEGNWQVSFSSDTLRTITLTQKDLPELTGIKQIVISPLSVTLTGEETILNDLELNIEQEGKLLKLSPNGGGSRHTSSDGGDTVKLQLEADSFIDLDKLERLQINDQVFSLPE